MSTATSDTWPGCTWTSTGKTSPISPSRASCRSARAAPRASRGLQTLYLPEAHTDFVAAIIGEELGFLGVAALCGAYLLLVARGVRAALRAPDDFGSFLAFGLSTMFGVQALVNLAVALAVLPTKGLTLPFVSFGGSSLLMNAIAAGVLLNISRQSGEPAWDATPLPPEVDVSLESAMEPAAEEAL